MEPLVVLGLSINTRMLGLAVISRNLLLDHHIQLRKEPWTTQKGAHILASLQPWCTSYSITSVALSIPYEKQISTHTKELLESIKTHFKNIKIPCFIYNAKALYAARQETEGTTRKEMMRNVAELYPELSYYYHKELRNKTKYYIKLFEAVGVATLHLQKATKRK